MNTKAPALGPSGIESAQRLHDCLGMVEQSMPLGFLSYRFEDDCATWTAGLSTLLGAQCGTGRDTLDAFLQHLDAEGREDLERRLDDALRNHHVELLFKARARVDRRTLVGTLRLHYDGQRPVEMFGMLQGPTPTPTPGQAPRLQSPAPCANLATSFAHEFRHDLNAIVMGINLLRRLDCTGARSHATLDIMARRTRALSALTYRLAEAEAFRAATHNAPLGTRESP